MTATRIFRTDGFLVCSACESRNKPQDAACHSCGASLAHAGFVETAVAASTAGPRRSLSEGARAALGLAVVGAIGVGVLVRSTFGGPGLEALTPPHRAYVSATAQARSATPSRAPLEWAERPQTTGTAELTLGSAPSSIPQTVPMVVEAGPYTVDAASVGGMVSITPGSAPSIARRARAGRTFTNDDLDQLRSGLD